MSGLHFPSLICGELRSSRKKERPDDNCGSYTVGKYTVSPEHPSTLLILKVCQLEIDIDQLLESFRSYFIRD